MGLANQKCWLPLWTFGNGCQLRVKGGGGGFWLFIVSIDPLPVILFFCFLFYDIWLRGSCRESDGDDSICTELRKCRPRYLPPVRSLYHSSSDSDDESDCVHFSQRPSHNDDDSKQREKGVTRLTSAVICSFLFPFDSVSLLEHISSCQRRTIDGMRAIRRQGWERKQTARYVSMQI